MKKPGQGFPLGRGRDRGSVRILGRAWGEVHRVRGADVDLSVGGCASRLGCFRVLSFREDRDGRYSATGGDAWILAVEFPPTPRAYSVLVYGNSDREDSPNFYNQAEMFADNCMRMVAFTEEDIDRNLRERYRPGERGVVAGQPIASNSDRDCRRRLARRAGGAFDCRRRLQRDPRVNLGDQRDRDGTRFPPECPVQRGATAEQVGTAGFEPATRLTGMPRAISPSSTGGRGHLAPYLR
jgi:hypothetical protein